jgi:hypothetical protein
MTAMGMPGVSTWNFGEAFAHLYLDSVAMNHNSIGRGYETFGNERGNGGARFRRNNHHGVVSSASAAPRSHVVSSRQSQLSGDRRADRSRGCSIAFQGDAAQFLQEVVGFMAKGADAGAVCVSDSAGSR